MIEFNFLAKPTLRKRNHLKVFLMDLCRNEGYTLEELSVVFCSDDYLLQLNRKHLQHDYYTDIITFDYSQKAGTINGELFISVDRVRENARAYQSQMEIELHRVIFHGLLHLCGYKDGTKSQQATMRKKEEFYLNSYLHVPRETTKESS